MPTLVGPSHHAFYGYLHRRRLWLNHLADAFTPYGTATWPAALERLDDSFKRTFARLNVVTANATANLGLGRPLPLQDVLDDTPIESFLINLSEDLDAYQHNLLELMEQSVARQGWLEELERISMLWGRELAQECLMSPWHGKIVRSSGSVRGVYEAMLNVLQGGDFVWKPFLVRRYTDEELQYELRHCPHSKLARQTADLACKLESMVFRGFSEALLSNVSFGRQSRGSYCLDELKLPRQI